MGLRIRKLSPHHASMRILRIRAHVEGRGCRTVDAGSELCLLRCGQTAFVFALQEHQYTLQSPPTSSMQVYGWWETSLSGVMKPFSSLIMAQNNSK